MRLDVEKFLNNNGLKIGDKVKLSNGDICEICQILNGEIVLRPTKNNPSYHISDLMFFDFKKVKSNKKNLKRKFGDLKCTDFCCDGCPLCGIACDGSLYDTVRERFEATLKKHPELEPLRTYLENELDKELE